MKKIIVFVGSSLLIIGSFLPVLIIQDKTSNFFDKDIKIPVQNIPDNAMMYAGITIVAIALLAIILAVINKIKFIWILGILAGVILAGVYFGFHSTKNNAQDDLQKQTAMFGKLFNQFTNQLFESVQLQGPGWYVIPCGIVLLIISSLIKRKLESNP